MLEEHEAADVLENGRDQNRILRRYFEVTGFEEANANAIWHHVTGLDGAPCSSCGRPLRTPRARMCAACGAPPPGGRCWGCLTTEVGFLF